MASEDLGDVFEKKRVVDRWVVARVSCLEIPLHAELNIVYGLARR